jgi:hypothetical protein
MVEMTPVDYVSRALVHISRTSGAFGESFHLLNPDRIHFDDLVGAVQRRGWPVEQIRGVDWLARLRAALDAGQANALHPLLDTVSEFVTVGQDATSYSVDALARALRGSGIICPPLDDALLGTYFDWLIETGYLDQPPAP